MEHIGSNTREYQFTSHADFVRDQPNVLTEFPLCIYLKLCTRVHHRDRLRYKHAAPRPRPVPSAHNLCGHEAAAHTVQLVNAVLPARISRNRMDSPVDSPSSSSKCELRSRGFEHWRLCHGFCCVSLAGLMFHIDWSI